MVFSPYFRPQLIYHCLFEFARIAWRARACT